MDALGLFFIAEALFEAMKDERVRIIDLGLFEPEFSGYLLVGEPRELPSTNYHFIIREDVSQVERVATLIQAVRRAEKNPLGDYFFTQHLDRENNLIEMQWTVEKI